MSYYHAVTLKADSFEAVVEQTTEALQQEGFGVLTTIDMQATLKKKLDVDMEKYTILGACNPPFAHKAVQAEPHIGLMLPCNVTVREIASGTYEVAAVDPIASMQSIQNEQLGPVAEEVNAKLQAVIASLAQ